MIKTLPSSGIHNPKTLMIVETYASELGYGGIIKQKLKDYHEEIVRFHSSPWNETQQKYSIMKKEILSIVLCVTKF